MVAGPCRVTDNAEGMTHNEMQAPCPPPWHGDNRKNELLWTRLWGQDFSGHLATAISSLHFGSLRG